MHFSDAPQTIEGTPPRVTSLPMGFGNSSQFLFAIYFSHFGFGFRKVEADRFSCSLGEILSTVSSQ